MLRDIALALCIYAYASQPLLATMLEQLAAGQAALCSYREDGTPSGDVPKLVGACAHAVAIPAPPAPFRAPVIIQAPAGAGDCAVRFAAMPPGLASEERARAPPICATSMGRA